MANSRSSDKSTILIYVMVSGYDNDSMPWIQYSHTRPNLLYSRNKTLHVGEKWVQLTPGSDFPQQELVYVH
jgi:hypothetical protein